MREGPPPWVHPPALAESMQFAVDDGYVAAEIWAEGIRFRAVAWEEDDAEYDYEKSTRYFSLEECIGLCNTLATAKDSRYDEEAWGRLYQRVFSLDAPNSSVQIDPKLQNIWFYPMNERRMTFRLSVGPVIPALRDCLQWAAREAPKVQPKLQGAQNRQIRRCLELLEQASRRVGAE